MAGCIIYARQSFGQEVESTSIDVQLEACRNWAREHGLMVLGEYSDANCSSEHYPQCDEGIEASRIDRGYQRWLREQRTTGRKQYKQGLGKAFQRIADGGVTHLLVYTRNRLGRTADGSYLDRFLTNYLLEHHVSLVTVQDGTVLDFSNDFMSIVMQLKDSLDYKSLKEKRLAAIASIDRRINGYTKWSNAIGVVMQNGQVVFDQDYAEAIRHVFEAVVNRATYGAILHTLNTTYRNLARGRQWYMSNVYHMLKNPVYCGHMLNREGVMDRAKNIPNPVVPFSLWQRAQEAMETKRCNGRRRMAPGHHFLPLSGYLYCACGRRLTMYVDRGKIAYHCLNGKDHTTTLYVPDEVLLTIQTTFITGLLESRRRLEALTGVTDEADGLKASIERLQTALRAKMSLVETEDDVAMYKPVLDALKGQIKAKKAELMMADAQASGNQEEAMEEFERDFAAITECRLLPEETYTRLMQECIDKIYVYDDHIDVAMTPGMVMPIPRIKGKHHAKRLMRCELLCDSDNGGVDAPRHYQLHFFDGETVVAGGECAYEDENLSVWIHRPAEQGIGNCQKTPF